MLPGTRVLYVDDRADARQLVTAMLTRHGAAVIEAASTEEALDVLTRANPQVILTDVAMPGRDGYDLLATVRADARWNHIPVMALTAHARSDDEARAADAGFRGFLRKPIESDDLAGAIARVLAELVTTA